MALILRAHLLAKRDAVLAERTMTIVGPGSADDAST
jgi:hypothetical protein